MKILQINKFYYRRRGAETYMLDLIDLLQQHNHEVAVFSMDHPETLDDDISQRYRKYFVSNIEYGNLDTITLKHKAKSVSRVLWSKEAANNIERLIQEFKPDIAHVHNIYHQISPSILPVLKRYGIPIVHTLHDYKLIAPNYNLLAQGKIDESSKGHRYYNVIKTKGVKDSTTASTLAAMEMYLHKELKVYEKNVDCFISPSEFLKHKVLEWDTKVKRIEVIPNFIDASTIQTSYTNMQKSEHKSDGYLLYAGALYEEKGIDLLLDSLRNVQYSFGFRIAGDGPQASQLKHYAKAHNLPVQFLGHLQKHQLAEQLSQAMAVVVPSRWYENYPYSVIEAFAYGKPVIAANIGGLPELVQPGKTGYLFEPNDVNDLTKTLNEALSNPEELQRLGQHARAWVEAELNPEKHYQRIHALYKEYTN